MIEHQLSALPNGIFTAIGETGFLLQIISGTIHSHHSVLLCVFGRNNPKIENRRSDLLKSFHTFQIFIFCEKSPQTSFNIFNIKSLVVPFAFAFDLIRLPKSFPTTSNYINPGSS